ncbi:uncharacterized protein TNCV_1132051 [Trichonephila clavipes]|nr:uncharacterized protein TNCV_1132051 [Trichonephila clavipes]
MSRVIAHCPVGMLLQASSEGKEANRFQNVGGVELTGHCTGYAFYEGRRWGIQYQSKPQQLEYWTIMANCQVIYSQFGLAIHQNDHQARRRFVEWAQNEIAVVPDFHKRILFSDEAHFWLNGYVNKQNCRIWSEANPQIVCRNTVTSRKTDCLVRFMGWWNPSSKTMKATTLQSMVIGIEQGWRTFMDQRAIFSTEMLSEVSTCRQIILTCDYWENNRTKY